MVSKKMESERNRMKTLNDPICGNCKHYNGDTLLCDKHPEYGELVEQDTCKDWEEDE